MEVFGGRCVSHGLAEKLPTKPEKPRIAAQLLNPLETLSSSHPVQLRITRGHTSSKAILHRT